LITGLYIPGNSYLHRTSAKWKLSTLFLLGVGLVAMENIFVLGFFCASLVIFFLLTPTLGGLRLWMITRQVAVWMVLIFFAQLILIDSVSAVSTILRLILLVWLSSLITFTTRFSDMIVAISSSFSFLNKVGFSSERLGFLIALTIRMIPIIMNVFKETREVQKARGLSYFECFALVPVLIRLIKNADILSEALAVRGFDKWGGNN
jgi:biotin transport system permease protein